MFLKCSRIKGGAQADFPRYTKQFIFLICVWCFGLEVWQVYQLPDQLNRNWGNSFSNIIVYIQREEYACVLALKFQI